MTAQVAAGDVDRDPRAVHHAGRIVGIDLARGVALLGMMATHMLSVTDRQSGDLTPLGWLFSGRASALFALLAGVSLALVTGGPTPKRGRDRARASVTIAVRALVIGLIGALLGETGTPVAVILCYYAVLFVLALPFLGLRTPVLATLAVAWGVLSPVVSLALRDGHQQLGLVEQVGISTIVQRPWDSLVELVLTGYYPALTWLTYLLAGLAVGRLDLRARRTAVWLVGVGASVAAVSWVVPVVALGAGAGTSLTDGSYGAVRSWWDLVSAEYFGTTPTGSWEWLLVVAPHSGTPFDLLGVTGSAVAVLGLCLLLVRVPLLRTLTHPVAAAGAMTLTLYTVHVVVLAMTRGWGLFDNPVYYAAHVIAALTFAPLWLMNVRRGPLELVVHTVATDIGDAVVRRPRAASG